ncbi:DUF6958 family protein [Pelagibacterium halotolerans]|uniref:DUF6958 family protein n=1 Tax=Pelagibacterium halotolerans TaxID=531813 RepID=UPI00384E7FFC
MTNDKIECQTPTPGKKPVRIPRWKYETVRAAILQVLRETPGLEFRELSAAVREKIGDETLTRLGSLSWHVTTVKLDLETRGEVQRLSGKGPQRLSLTK